MYIVVGIFSDKIYVVALELFKWSEDIQEREESHEEVILENTMYETEKSPLKYVK